jgi:transposase-like protein
MTRARVHVAKVPPFPRRWKFCWAAVPIYPYDGPAYPMLGYATGLFLASNFRYVLPDVGSPFYRLEAKTNPAYLCQMPEMYKCRHCGALYEVTYEKTVSRDEHAAKCQVCGKQMDSRNASSTPRYELVKMPDGTDV